MQWGYRVVRLLTVLIYYTFLAFSLLDNILQCSDSWILFPTTTLTGIYIFADDGTIKKLHLFKSGSTLKGKNWPQWSIYFFPHRAGASCSGKHKRKFFCCFFNLSSLRTLSKKIFQGFRSFLYLDISNFEFLCYWTWPADREHELCLKDVWEELIENIQKFRNGNRRNEGQHWHELYTYCCDSVDRIAHLRSCENGRAPCLSLSLSLSLSFCDVWWSVPLWFAP